jgi:hypothetical protein
MERLLKFPNVYVLLTVIAGGLPFAIYFCERTSGSLPTPSEWYATGVNHGPWRTAPEAFGLYYPIIILLVATLIAFSSRGKQEHKSALIVSGVLLGVIQIAILALQMYTLAWTID